MNIPSTAQKMNSCTSNWDQGSIMRAAFRIGRTIGTVDALLI